MSSRTWSVGTLTYTMGGLAVVFGWLLWGDFAFSIRDRIIPPLMQLLFKKYQVSDTGAGILFSSIPIAIGMLTGPFIGYMSDRHRGPRGRRIPYLLWPTPFIVLSIIGLAFSPQIGAAVQKWVGHALSLNLSTLIVLSTFWMIFELAAGIANMIYGGLVNDVVPQLLVGRFFALFRCVSLLVGGVVGFTVMGKSDSYDVWLFLSIGAVYGIGFTLMCLNVKEGKYPDPPAASDLTRGQRLVAATKTYFKDGYSHSYYLWFFAATILPGMAGVPTNLYGIYYAMSLGMSRPAYFHSVSYSLFISFALAFPLGYLADRFHPLRMTILGLGLNMLAMFLTGLYATDAGTYAYAIIINSVLAGFNYTVSASISQRLLPRNKFSQIGSAGGTIGCLIGIVFAPAVGMLLDYTHHNYHYIFFMAYVLTALAFVTNLILHSKFMALGGPEHYVAPAGKYEKPSL